MRMRLLLMILLLPDTMCWKPPGLRSRLSGNLFDWSYARNV